MKWGRLKKAKQEQSELDELKPKEHHHPHRSGRRRHHPHQFIVDGNDPLDSDVRSLEIYEIPNDNLLTRPLSDEFDVGLSCFNCGGTHTARDCTMKRDAECFRHNLTVFKKLSDKRQNEREKRRLVKESRKESGLNGDAHARIDAETKLDHFLEDLHQRAQHRQLQQHQQQQRQNHGYPDWRKKRRHPSNDDDSHPSYYPSHHSAVPPQQSSRMVVAAPAAAASASASVASTAADEYWTRHSDSRSFSKRRRIHPSQSGFYGDGSSMPSHFHSNSPAHQTPQVYHTHHHYGRHSSQHQTLFPPAAPVPAHPPLHRPVHHHPAHPHHPPHLPYPAHPSGRPRPSVYAAPPTHVPRAHTGRPFPHTPHSRPPYPPPPSQPGTHIRFQ